MIYIITHLFHNSSGSSANPPFKSLRPNDAYMRQGTNHHWCKRQAVIRTNAEMLLIRPLGTKFCEILIEIKTFSFKKMHLKMSSANGGHFVSASMG